MMGLDLVVVKARTQNSEGKEQLDLRDKMGLAKSGRGCPATRRDQVRCARACAWEKMAYLTLPYRMHYFSSRKRVRAGGCRC